MLHNTKKVDDPIAELAQKFNVKVYRGSLEDKLERWNGAAKEYSVDYIVTFDGDDLFCDPYLLDRGAEQITEGQFDFYRASAGFDLRSIYICVYE